MMKCKNEFIENRNVSQYSYTDNYTVNRSINFSSISQLANLVNHSMNLNLSIDVSQGSRLAQLNTG